MPFDSSPRLAHVAALRGFPNNPGTREQFDAFREGLRDAGWIEGQNLVIETRFYEDHPERMPDLATELVALKPDVLVAGINPSVLALKRATESIPIVFLAMPDPVTSGIIASYARSGGNITGTTRTGGVPLGPKQLDLLSQVVLGLLRVAVVYESASEQGVSEFQAIQGAAQSIGIDAQPVPIASPDEVPTALEAGLAGRPQALIEGGGVIIPSSQDAIIGFATRHRLPSASDLETATAAGGLIYYGPDVRALYRRAGNYYVDRILRGAKPADVPVEQATVFNLIINRTTAQALGVTIPPEVAAQVTEWIQ
jgi:putative ABC transport system substrate-binding protein